MPFDDITFACEDFLGVVSNVLLQLTQPLLEALARAQSSNHIEVAGAQLEVVGTGTKKPDRQTGCGTSPSFLDPAQAKHDPTIHHLAPKPNDGVVSCIGCCTQS